MILPIPLPPPAYEQAIEAVAACGIKAANVQISYARELQSDAVTIRDLGGTDEVRFRCVRRAVHPDYFVFIEHEGQRAAYYAFVGREDRREARAEALDWLGTRGMLGRIPRFDPARNLGEFAEALETACSAKAGTVLEVLGPNLLTLRKSFLERGPADDDTLTCVMRMLAASNAEGHGVSLGFFGNEAAAGADRR